MMFAAFFVDTYSNELFTGSCQLDNIGFWLTSVHTVINREKRSESTLPLCLK